MDKTYWVYIIRCSDRTLYTGYTTDLENRIKRHNAGKAAKYTRGRTPVELVYHEEYTDQGTALRREKAIKALTKQQKLLLLTNKNEGKNHG